MSKPTPYGPTTDMSDAVATFLDGAAKLLFWLGLAATIVSVALLVYTYAIFSTGAQGVSESQALLNIDLLQKFLLGGVVAIGLGTSYMFWGEETLGPLQLAGAALLYFSPLILPSIFAGSENAAHDAAPAAVGALQSGGIVYGILAIGLTMVDLLSRVKLRTVHGTKADQLKYGKGVKEEDDIKNIFMGKCWQLPFCRKFVRERCPIYHSKRTCWKERVGCMCEEAVIRDAMAGKVIPKDEIAAAKFIPYNNKLNLEQKAERCRQCVIYNEHQKHKYKLWLPVTFGFFVLIYAAFRGPLLEVMGAFLITLDKIVGRATFRDTSAVSERFTESSIPFKEIFLVCLMFVAFTYALKTVEYLIFKRKV